MARVRLENGQILIDDKPCSIRGGSMHYWGIPRGLWPKIIEQYKEAHFNTIVTYIPWFYHEPEEGQFDFTGTTVPERDLIGFLELVKEYNLYLIARPGPFINSELRGGGYPAWLFENYPEVVSRRSDGKEAFWVGRGLKVPGQLHPKYLELVYKWYEAVIPVLVKHALGRDGPLILFQPDNEVNLCFTFGVSGSLYDEHVIDPEIGLWKSWLNKEAKIREYCEPPKKAEEIESSRDKVLNWLKFKQWYTLEYTKRLAKKAKELSLNTPYLLNEPTNKTWPWGAGDHATAKRYFEKEGQNAFTAAHTYLYGGEMDLYGLAAVITRLECCKCGPKQPTMSIEGGCGWFKYNEMKRAEYNWELNLKTLVGHGMDSFNIYPFAERLNPEESSITGSLYQYDAPLTEYGEKREVLFAIVSGVSHFLEGWEDYIVQTEKRSDVNIGLFRDLHLLARPERSYEDGLARLREADYGLDQAKSAYNALGELAKLLTRLNINFEYKDLENENDVIDSKKPLLVPNPSFIPDHVEKRIQTHLEKDGTVIIFPNMAGSNVLPGREVKTKCIPAPGFRPGDTLYRVVNGLKVKQVPLGEEIYTFTGLNNRDQILATYQERPIAFQRHLGKGRVIVMGFLPQYLIPSILPFFKEFFLDDLKLDRSCWAHEEGIHVVQRSTVSGEADMLTLVNYSGREINTRVTYSTVSGKDILPRRTLLNMPGKSARFLLLNIPTSNTWIRYCTEEIYPAGDKNTYYIKPQSRGVGEIAFADKVEARLNDEQLKIARSNSDWIAIFPPCEKERILTIR